VLHTGEVDSESRSAARIAGKRDFLSTSPDDAEHRGQTQSPSLGRTLTEHLVVGVILWVLEISGLAAFVGVIAVSTIILFRHLWQLLRTAWNGGEKA
jgi:hypothetical protein